MDLELKWLKRLRRRWLRKQVAEMEIYDDDRLFNWIYNAPYTQWNLRLWCARNARCKDCYDDVFSWVTERDAPNYRWIVERRKREKAIQALSAEEQEQVLLGKRLL